MSWMLVSSSCRAPAESRDLVSSSPARITHVGLGDSNASGDPGDPDRAALDSAPAPCFGSASGGATCSVEAPAAGGDEPQQSTRRGLPPPFASPPYPSGEYQGYPLIGIPPSDTTFPLTRFLYERSFGDWLQEKRIKAYGWLNTSANISTSEDSNMPSSYWLVADSVQLNQAILRVEREVDTAQTEHVDWGFRSTFLYGTDYRYMTSGGWFSDQLLVDNELYGFDTTEQYVDVYFPGVSQGLDLRIGRWIACPDIETQFAPDNYLATHSLLFTVDTYTQTGVMATMMLDRQWTVQAGLHAGTDMAPWYEGAVATGMAGVRWVALDNKDSIYLVLNAINDAEFQRFTVDGQPAGHDNFNYIVGTWQHAFSPEVHTKTESYLMWQKDTVVGGTPSIGPAEDFGGGGGIGADIPGTTLTYGILNYTMFQTSPSDFLTIRNEVIEDQDGARYGFAGTYSSHTIGWTHNFSPLLQIRPEIGYYRNWDREAFDLGTDEGMLLAGFDLTLRF